MNKIILASGSPRRKEILEMLGYDFEVITSNAKEDIDTSIRKSEYVKKLAMIKAKAVQNKLKNNNCILGFDTIVVIDDMVLGKPKDENNLREMLNILKNRTHYVYTGCAILYNNKEYSFYNKTKVTFSDITDEEMEYYIKTNEPYDKAGGYAIQGYASRFVKRIEGDYYTIVGLPANMVYNKLKKILK